MWTHRECIANISQAYDSVNTLHEGAAFVEVSSTERQSYGATGLQVSECCIEETSGAMSPSGMCMWVALGDPHWGLRVYMFLMHLRMRTLKLAFSCISTQSTLKWKGCPGCAENHYAHSTFTNKVHFEPGERGGGSAEHVQCQYLTHDHIHTDRGLNRST